ncbi:hypothetical protein [Synechococcus sp. CC9902]|uniref:hypothetical protein n=1 Tax=Synechococcus sp. (strain CC9902) TaxID=316279 RepID=UPI00030753F9|nr:hypothetical protein [Synechococcus sp. CC9902]
MRPIVSIQGATTTAMRPNALAWFNAAQDDAQSLPWQPRSQPGQSAERWSWGGLMWCGLCQVGTDASFQPLVVPTGRQGAAGLE